MPRPRVARHDVMVFDRVFSEEALSERGPSALHQDPDAGRQEAVVHSCRWPRTAQAGDVTKPGDAVATPATIPTAGRDSR